MKHNLKLVRKVQEAINKGDKVTLQKLINQSRKAYAKKNNKLV